MPWSKTEGPHYLGQLGLSDKCRSIKMLVVRGIFDLHMSCLKFRKPYKVHKNHRFTVDSISVHTDF